MCQAHIKLWYWFGLAMSGLPWISLDWYDVVWVWLGIAWIVSLGLIWYAFKALLSSFITNPGWVGGRAKSKLRLKPA